VVRAEKIGDEAVTAAAERLRELYRERDEHLAELECRHEARQQVVVGPGMKQCSACGEAKSPEDFYRYVRRKDGLSDWCKACQSRYNRFFHVSHARNVRFHASLRRFGRRRAIEVGIPLELGRPGEMYRCKTCGEEKPRTPEHFYRDLGRSDGLRARCKTCANARRSQRP
jgi:hypothetical protein